MDSKEEKTLLSPRMPFLVLELLRCYLDFYTLQTLRLVCKTAKSWVENTDLLRQFQVKITGESRLNDLLRAPNPVPWNSFLFTRNCKCLPIPDIERFLAMYGDVVLDLKLNWDWSRSIDMQQVKQNALCLLLGCHHLESLHCNQLMFAPVQPKHGELTRRLLENWKNLRHFHVAGNFDVISNPLEEMTFFSEMLSRCTQLETLTVPLFDFRPLNKFEEVKNFQSLVVTPLLDTIEQGRLRSLKFLPVACDDNFLRLAIACREKGTLLYTWRLSSSLWSTFLKNLPHEHLSVLDIMGDLNIVTDTIISHPLTNVRKIHLGIGDFDMENEGYSVPAFPHLSEVGFYFLEYPHEALNRSHKGLELFVHRLAQVRRPTVESLHILYPLHVGLHMKISPVDLCTSFENLRVLHVNNWMGENTEWLTLWPLIGNTLVKLKLEHCPNLSDRGILGNDLNQPAFFQLKRLRKLDLRYYNVEPRCRITVECFLHAFRHMPLQYFSFIADTPSSSKSVLLLSGDALKAMWNGAFGETIEYFQINRKDLMPKRPPATRKSRSGGDGRRKPDKHLDPETGIRKIDLVHDDPSTNCNACCSIA